MSQSYFFVALPTSADPEVRTLREAHSSLQHRAVGRAGWVVLCLLGGSWVVISMVISPLIWVVTIVTLLITPLTTTHEPPRSGVEKTCC